MTKKYGLLVLQKALPLLVALLMCLPMATVCSAATTVKVDYHATDESITVTLDTDRREKTAVLTVEKDGRFYVLAEFERSAKDSFVYTCKLPEDCSSGKFTVKVTIGGEVATGSFEHINKGLAQEALDILNAAAKGDFAAAMNQVYQVLAVDIEEFNTYADLLTELYYKYRPSANLTTAEFSVLYSQCLALSKMHTQTDKQITATFLAENASKIAFDYERFSSLSDGEKEEIIERFQAGEYSEDTLEIQYQHWFCLANINQQRGGSVSAYRTALFETHSALLQLDLSDYEESTDKAEVIRLTMERSYQSIKDLRSAFYAAVSKVKEDNKNSHGGSGSGSGSGSSGGGTASFINWDMDSTNEPGNQNSNQGTSSIFSDVPDGHWGASSIHALYERGVINGAGNGKFLPDNAVTRAEFSKILMGSLFGDYQAADRAAFADVSENDWFCNAVNAAAELGIITGNGDGSFLPNETVSRQDMAVMLYRALIKSGAEFRAESLGFADDNEISEYAKEAVSLLGGAGILNGMENGSFHPDGELSRAQAAKALYEALRISSKL